MSEDRIVKTVCGLCGVWCGMLVHVRNGRAIKVEGDRNNPTSQGVLCRKGQAALEYLYHTDRLEHPLKRVGDRGEGKWQQISWDAALNTIARELTRIKDNYGPEYLVAIQGANKGMQGDLLARFAGAFGTPNVASSGHVCHAPRMLASMFTCGFSTHPDYEYPPACTVVWGMNAQATNIPLHAKLVSALNRGTQLVVVDPVKTEIARRADIWVRLRPGSDLALALGMINVIINEGLYDTAFVEKWTVGFDKLSDHIQDYSPEKTEEITWVPADTIRKVARFYAINKPACIQWGNAVDQGVNSLQTARAIAILRAITGNLGVPGGELKWLSPPLLRMRSPQFSLSNTIPADRQQRRISLMENMLPVFSTALPQRVVRAILDGDPYSLKAAYIYGSNPLLSYTNAQETYQAFKKLDFTVVADMFMTPTAALADIVLPVATFLEFDAVVVSPTAVQCQQKVTERGECWSDYKIFNELAKKLGLDDYFWDDEEKLWDAVLEPSGLTLAEFKEVGVIPGTKQYQSHERDGFDTPSGKVELYSSRLDEWGFDPLPVYREPPETPLSNPELAVEYPLILTSRKIDTLIHSGGRQIDALRSAHPEPIVSIHPEAAGKLGIANGDWVYIETIRGRIKQKATFNDDIDPRVVVPDFGWWFPEKGPSELYNWAESNINILTDHMPPYNREMGSSNLRGILCNVYKS